MTPTTYGRDFAYCLKSHGGVRGFNASLWRFLLRCTLFCHSVATFLTSVSSYEGGCGFEVNKTSSENAPVYGSDDFNDADNHRASVQVELDMQNLLDSIKLSMESWINGLNKANKEKLRIEGKDHSFFITFNYTKTLEEVYNIPKGQICHIHGCINESDLIVGHGKTSEEIYEHAFFMLECILRKLI